jgi:hypothetical protein
MIFRAIFWIGLVSLLAPHEPDLGLGRPGAGTSIFSSSAVSSTADRLAALGKDCGVGCAGGLGLPDLVHLRANARVMAGLAKVKADITADQRARASRPAAQLARDI